MLLKKLAVYHILPACLAALISWAFISSKDSSENPVILQTHHLAKINCIDGFKINDLSQQLALSMALKQKVPVLMGSSELTSSHLEGLAHNFFTGKPGDRFLSFGHAGFQSLAILTVLSANAPLLKDAKITIILSPGWFEKMYSKGTSLKSFFEYCPPNYMCALADNVTGDGPSRNYIREYISKNFDKISKPDAALSLFGLKTGGMVQELVNAPFAKFSWGELQRKKAKDPYLNSQKMILEALSSKTIPAYHFKNRRVNWDSLHTESLKQFKTISNNNSLAVENSYYDQFLSKGRKKRLIGVAREHNEEFKDLMALVEFLKRQQIKPIFVILPLNAKAHENVSVLQPIINDIDSLLIKNEFKLMDMFSANARNYEEGILEDIMHPYNTGWYKIDKFILDNFHDE